MERVDVFGKPHTEIVHDLSDPTPVSIGDDYGEDFYSSLEIGDADLVVVRDSSSLPDLAREVLEENHYQMCARFEEEPEIYIGDDAPSDFPGMNPYEAKDLAGEGVESLVEEYLESDLYG